MNLYRGVLVLAIPLGSLFQSASSQTVLNQTPSYQSQSKTVALDSSKQAQGPKDSLALGPVMTGNVPVTAKTRSDSLHVVKHGFNHRQQIITGSIVMSCLAMIMVTMNNYNPR
jgi:hypothetical protein